MNFLDLPEVQSGLVPFATAIILGVLLGYWRSAWFGLAAILGLFAAAYVMGILDFSPTRSANRMFLVTLIVSVTSLIYREWVERSRPMPMPEASFSSMLVFTLMIAAGACYLVWKPAMRQEGLQTFATLGMAAGYAIVVAAGTLSLTGRSLRSLSATTFLALASGICAILGASASLGQAAIALGAASGALLLLAAFSNRWQISIAFTAPAATACALIMVTAVTFAKVSPFVLLPLALLPWMVRLPVIESWPRFLRAANISVYALAAGAAAVLLAWWHSASAPVYY